VVISGHPSGLCLRNRRPLVTIGDKYGNPLTKSTAIDVSSIPRNARHHQRHGGRNNVIVLTNADSGDPEQTSLISILRQVAAPTPPSCRSITETLSSSRANDAGETRRSG